MHKARVGIVGASGYSGIEATRILALHPNVELAFVTSDRWAGDTVERRTGLPGAAGRLVYVAPGEAEALAADCAAVLLATPAEVSLELAPKLLERGTRVVDLSGAFRLRDAEAFRRYYKLAPPEATLQASAVYAVTELFRDQVRGARFVSNAGCYATGAALAIAPLVRSGLVETDALIVDAASGVTGAGRKATEELSFSEVADDFRTYKVLAHQHTPEIAQTLSGIAGTPVWPTFTPHLLPLKRGILSTVYATLKPGHTFAQVEQAFANAYAAEPFVSLVGSADAVALKNVVGTNRCLLGVSGGSVEQPRRVIVVSAIDNLVKGAAGQAVQNLNLMLGFEEGAGLTSLRGFHP